MSDRYLRLVANLTPPGRAYVVPSPIAYRTRFVLFILAYLADDNGECTASVTDLAALTVLEPPMVRSSIQALEDEGLVEVVRTPSSANLYRLNSEQLQDQQFVAKLRRGGPLIGLLSEYGLDIRSLNTLRRVGLDTIPKLGAKIEAFRQIAATDGAPRGFHDYLDVRNMGVRIGEKILAAYDAWCADEERDPQTALDPGSATRGPQES